MPVLPKAKDEKLAQNIAKGVMNLQEANRDAGYSGDPAHSSKRAKQPQIVARVAELREARNRVVLRMQEQELETSAAIAKKIGLSRESILRGLHYNAQRCLRGTPILDANGVQTGKYSGKPDANGANQAFKLLGQECFNMFVEKLEIGSPGDFSRMNDEEFEKAFQEEALAAGLPQDAVAGLLTFQPETEKPDESNE